MGRPKLKTSDVLDFCGSSSLGQLEGVFTTDKYSKSVSIDTSDSNVTIWTLPDPLVYLGDDIGDGVIHYLTSDNDNDTVDMIIVGMLETWEFDSETVKLTGQTPVSTTKKYIRIVRMKNDNGIELQGDVYITSVSDFTDGVPDDTDDIQAHVLADTQQTLMSYMSSPAKFKTLITNVDIGILNTSPSVNPTNAIVELRVREFGKTFLTKDTYPLNSDGTSYINKHYHMPKEIKPKSDYHFRVVQVGRNNTALTVTHDVTFIHEDKLVPVYLEIPD